MPLIYAYLSSNVFNSGLFVDKFNIAEVISDVLIRESQVQDHTGQ